MGKKNKQFIVKLCHKYIQNINEDIFFFKYTLLYSTLSPSKIREPMKQQTVLLLKKPE